MENQNKKSQEQAGAFTGDESQQNPVDASTLGHFANEIVIENDNGTQIIDVHGVAKAPLTEKIRKPVEEVTTRVSTDANTIVQEEVKTTVPTKDPKPAEEGTQKTTEKHSPRKKK